MGARTIHSHLITAYATTYHQFSMPNTVQAYPLAVHSWRSARDPILIRHAKTSTLIASFPVEFVEKGGDNSWRYVIDVVGQLIETATSPGSAQLLEDASGSAVRVDGPVYSGVFWLKIDGEPFSTLNRSPER